MTHSSIPVIITQWTHRWNSTLLCLNLVKRHCWITPACLPLGTEEQGPSWRACLGQVGSQPSKWPQGEVRELSNTPAKLAWDRVMGLKKNWFPGQSMSLPDYHRCHSPSTVKSHEIKTSLLTGFLLTFPDLPPRQWYWIFLYQLTIKTIPKDTSTGQPDLDNSPIRQFSQVILDCSKLSKFTSALCHLENPHPHMSWFPPLKWRQWPDAGSCEALWGEVCKAHSLAFPRRRASWLRA